MAITRFAPLPSRNRRKRRAAAPRGTLRFDGTDVTALSGRALRAARRRIGTVYQQHNLVGRLRVVHNVLAGNLGRWSSLTAIWSLVRPHGVASALGALSCPEASSSAWRSRACWCRIPT